MSDPWISAGPDAERAFDIGIRAAALAWVAAIGFLVWVGVVNLVTAGFSLVVLFPPYLLVVAAVLSKWLGLDKDISDLRRVRREQHTTEFRK